jgi:hypothetical protein
MPSTDALFKNLYFAIGVPANDIAPLIQGILLSPVIAFFNDEPHKNRSPASESSWILTKLNPRSRLFGRFSTLVGIFSLLMDKGKLGLVQRDPRSGRFKSRQSLFNGLAYVENEEEIKRRTDRCGHVPVHNEPGSSQGPGKATQLNGEHSERHG